MLDLAWSVVLSLNDHHPKICIVSAMKKYFLLFFLSSGMLAFAQVPKKIVVEHFTNTLCSICANKNPGFYANYAGQTNTIHLAYHPSSPYSACIFSQHNVAENNARTNYYGIFGGTPRLVIQGDVIPTNVNYSLPSLFSAYTGQTSPASIRIEQTKFNNDSLQANIIIKTVDNHTLGNLVLYVALAEDTIFYNAPNGENQHYDVFRKSLSGSAGISLNLPATIGDSLVYSFSSNNQPAWNFNRIFTLAILQEESSKDVVQSEAAPANQSGMATTLSNTYYLGDGLSVNTYEDGLIATQKDFLPNRILSLFDLSGKQVFSKTLTNSIEKISFNYLPKGIYLYEISLASKTCQTGKVLLK